MPKRPAAPARSSRPLAAIATAIAVLGLGAPSVAGVVVAFPRPTVWVGLAPPIAPRLPVVLAPPPRPGWVWVAPYWRWTGARYVWVEGAWVFAPSGWERF